MFTGFPPEALTFFRGLARNNRREWFQPRKEIFENTVRKPMIELVEALNAGFAKLAPEYIADPGKAIYRIYRDTRFSSDKTPYKTHLAASFPRRGDRRSGPGFYFSLSLKELGVAGGVYDPAPEQLLAVRAWLADNHARFRKAARGPEKLMGKLHGESLQRIPKGFDAAHPAADLLKMKQWLYYTTLDPQLAASAKLLPEVMKRFRAMIPVVEMLSEPLSKARFRRVGAADALF